MRMTYISIFKKILFVLLLFFFTISTLYAAPVVTINQVRKENPNVRYEKVLDSTTLNFEVFPIASSKSSSWANPIIPETFIATIPKGRVYSSNGYIIVDGKLVKEFLWPWSPIKRNPEEFCVTDLPIVTSIKGKVAVIAQEGYRNYYHWMAEILPKLEVLKLKNVEYDWLYVPMLDLPFAKESLAALGIDPEKIIEALPNTYIEADELIVPSFVSRSCYSPKWVVDYLRKQFLSSSQYPINQKPSKNIFISRSRASIRRILNEDEIFKMLESHGFVRYDLEDLKFSEQIALFKEAEVIVAAHGAGLTNLLFCKPGTKVFELFQHREDDTFWYLSQTLGLKHDCIKTTDFNKKYDTKDTVVSRDLIEHNLIKKLNLIKISSLYRSIPIANGDSNYSI